MTSKKETTSMKGDNLSSSSEQHLIISREDLSDFIDISIKHLTFILYGNDRKSYYREFVINKASGKPRILHAVTGKLKMLQRRALDALQAEPTFRPSGYSHGFTLKKSIITNAAYHRRSKIIVKVDLKDFFPSIHFGRVQGMFMAEPFGFGNEAATTMAQLSCLDDKSGILPQGGVLSPYIANMLCRRLDKRLARIAQKHRCRFTRYADDITFSTNDIAKLNTDDLLKKVYQVIEAENFVVNEEKTKILTKKDRQIVTGIVVNDGMNVNRKYIRNLRATIHNCERTGVARQIRRTKFKDERNSRINMVGDGDPESAKKYFLKHLFGKINFLGNVVLSENQDKRHDEDQNCYQRIKTYEQLLLRFYNLKEVKNNSSINKIVKAAMRKRPNLKSLLSFKDQGEEKRSEVREQYREHSSVKASLVELGKAKTIGDISRFVTKKKKTDPRFFGITLGSNVDKAKERIRKLLNYPPIDQAKTKYLLESLKTDGGLKHLVHSNEDNWSIKDCYRILLENYEEEFYHLPKALKDEFESWKKALDDIAAQQNEDYPIDVMNEPMLSEQTIQLKKNTRFGAGGNDSTQLKTEVENIIRGLKREKLDIQIGKKIVKSLYTHVPSVLTAIKTIMKSMSSHSQEHGADVITIESKFVGKADIEIIIYDNAIKPAFDSLENRDFCHGKLTNVIKQTNGLCKYLVEATLTDGSRVGLDMHNERAVPPVRENGFVHRLVFPKIT